MPGSCRATVRATTRDLGAQIVLCLHDELLVHVPQENAEETRRLLDVTAALAAAMGPSEVADAILHEAFTGLGPHPRFADFFYYAVTTAFISPPGDVLAHSRGARSATMIEMLTAFALLTTYLSSFVDWGRAPQPEQSREG